MVVGKSARKVGLKKKGVGSRKVLKKAKVRKVVPKKVVKKVSKKAVKKSGSGKVNKNKVGLKKVVKKVSSSGVASKKFSKKKVVRKVFGKDVSSKKIVKGVSKKVEVKSKPKKGVSSGEVVKGGGKVVEKDKRPASERIDISQIAREVKAEQISSQRAPVKDIAKTKLPNKKGKKSKKGKKEVEKKGKQEYIFTGVQGFDELLENGIPKGSAILVAGGAGSGKTIFSLQTLVYQASLGKKCLYMSFEEREERLVDHMNVFGWDANKLIKKGKLKIQRISPFDITRNVDALLAKAKGELLIDIDPVIIPKGFKPDFIAVDSLTAIASAFTGKEESYRIYIEQLFRFFEKIGATSFLITETEQIPKIFSTSGVEEFLADGVVVFYNLKNGNVRENAIEVLKLRGAGHLKKIVAMQISEKGIMVYPEQEVFSEIE